MNAKSVIGGWIKSSFYIFVDEKEISFNLMLVLGLIMFGIQGWLLTQREWQQSSFHTFFLSFNLNHVNNKNRFEMSYWCNNKVNILQVFTGIFVRIPMAYIMMWLMYWNISYGEWMIRMTSTHVLFMIVGTYWMDLLRIETLKLYQCLHIYNKTLIQGQIFVFYSHIFDKR